MTDQDFDPTNLKEVAARIRELEADRREISDRIKDLYGAFKEAGGKTKALRWVLKFERLDDEKRVLQELHEADIANYLAALDIEATPLWRAAVAREALGQLNTAARATSLARARKPEPVN